MLRYVYRVAKYFDGKFVALNKICGIIVLIYFIRLIIAPLVFNLFSLLLPGK
jgi:membrane protein insertase Oxa1/YidC/SpoIIIJ